MKRRFALTLAVMLGWPMLPERSDATEWGRFYHYPYSYFPQNYRQPFRSRDFDSGPHGYPTYPMYMAFPPYFRADLYYPYFRHNKPGGTPCNRYQGNHYILDIF